MKKPTTGFGLYNFDNLWGFFHRRCDAKRDAMAAVGFDEGRYRKYLREGVFRIVKVEVRELAPEPPK